MKSAHRTLLAIIILAVISLTASESSALHELFKSYDLNKDGKVEKSEFSADMKNSAFDKIDTDKSREISESEWERLNYTAELDIHREEFKKMDKNKDRRITFFEFSDYADEHSNIERAFMTLDKDKDGALSPDEISIRPLFRMITIRF